MKWSDEKIEYLKQHYKDMSIKELSLALGATIYATKTKVSKLGLKRGNKHIWSDSEIAYLREKYADTRIEELSEYLGLNVGQIYHKANALGIKKSMDLIRELARENMSDKFLSYSKKKGDVPHNKGVKMPADVYARCKGTMFKKGNLPANTKEDGFLSIRGNSGFKCLYVRVALGKWVPYSRYIWEQHNGPIHPNHIIAFKDGNWRNCDISNLTLMSREDNMRRNSLHNYPKEVSNLIALRAAFSRKVNNLKKIQKNERES